MEVYLVGGAVRDELLGVAVTEQDWVITGATRDELVKLGFKPVGKSFPVFLHPDTKEEYALARTERKVSGGYHGFDFDASRHVTLEQDLKRRDLTINAMAKNADGEVIDPHGGLKDLADRTLRHVSDAFAEDPVRVLRIARFLARYERFGFTIAPETIKLMKKMVQKGELEFLVAERVFKEMDKALKEAAPVAFFQALRACDALKVTFPELDILYSVPQEEDIHPERNVGAHTELTLRQIAALTDDPATRFAALLHDVGKGLTPESEWPKHPGHEEHSVAAIKAFCARLRVPNEYKALALVVAAKHQLVNLTLKWTSEEMVAFIEQLDALRRPERFKAFLLAAKSIFRGRLGKAHDEFPQYDYCFKVLEAMKSVNTRKLIEQKSLKDPEQIKMMIHEARIAVVEPIRHEYATRYQQLHKY